MKVTKRIYKANCIEAGDRFVSLFQTNEKSMSKLMDMGASLAVDWGAECISITPFKIKVTKMAKMWDNKKKGFLELTERRYNNWVKLHPVSRIYDYEKTELFSITEDTPTDVWDCDATIDENMAEIRKRPAAPRPKPKQY